MWLTCKFHICGIPVNENKLWIKNCGANVLSHLAVDNVDMAL